MSRLGKIGGFLLVFLVLLVFYSRLPLGTALEFSTDESYETMKPFLCNQGHVLYKEIWNDQPPLLTVLLAGAFKIFGTSMLTARVVVAGFGLILVAVFHDLIRRRSGQACAVIATFFLLCSPGVILLSVAAMQEVPTVATELLAAWLLFHPLGRMSTSKKVSVPDFSFQIKLSHFCQSIGFACGSEPGFSSFDSDR